MDTLATMCSFCGRVMKGRLADLLVLSLVVVCALGASVNLNKLDIEELIKAHRQAALKRGSNDNDENFLGGNPCVDFPDHPFPCRKTDQCLPFRYICDKNFDCDDGSDEDIKMCTASKRPPIEEIKMFLQKHRKWIIPNLFGNRDIKNVAHALAISPTLKDFEHNLRLSKGQFQNFKWALEAVKDNHEETFEELGMPRGDWQEVSYIFKNLLEHGFDV